MATPRTPTQWYFMSNSGNWLIFDVFSTSMLEDAHFMGTKFINITIALNTYIVDFVHMMQINTSSGIQREIKRVVSPQINEVYQSFFNQHCEFISKSSIPEDKCSICLVPLCKPAEFDIIQTLTAPSITAETICGLNKCFHMFHVVCIASWLNTQFNITSISCPLCKTIYGVKTGDQPNCGIMDISYNKSSLTGHECYGTIVITYNFSDGISENGIRYTADGFPRVCFLPDSPEGKTVLGLLRIAWTRRLIFKIGTSITSGRPDCVVWNNIHHKTEEQSNFSGHGYPDPNYLANIRMELAQEGVKEDDLA